MSEELKKSESEKILEQIEALKTQSNQEKPQPEIQVPPEKAPEPTVESKAAPGKSGQAVSQTEAPSDKKPGKPEVDIKEWASKKGIRDADSAFRSLREMEQRLSRANAELQAARDVPRGTNQPPQYQPQPQFNPQFSPSSYPNYPMDREKIMEQEAKRYNMAPEDFERVLSLSNDIAAMHARRMKVEYDSQLQEITRETRRNSELRELMQDPLFTNEKVQFEMHKVLEENPRAFTHEPSPYLYAFNEAQRRLARQYLQEGRSSEESGGKSSIPTEPPKEGHSGPDMNFEKKPMNGIPEAFLKASTAEEQRKILTSLGAVQSY